MGKKLGMLAAAGLVLLIGAQGCTVLGSTYQRKVNEADNLAQQLGALQKKHDDLTRENAALKGRIEKLDAELSGMTAQRDKLAAEKAKLSSDLADVTGQRDKFADDNKELEKVLKAKTDSLSVSIVDLRRKIADLESENGKLKADLANVKKALAEKEKRAAELEGQNARQKEEIAGLQKAREEVAQKSSTYEQMLAKMKGEIEKGQVTISELKGKLTVNMVDAILFDSGKAEIKPEGLEVLKKVISVLEPVKDKVIRIEGHTDNVTITGMLARKYATNWELSAARALNVTRYLQDQGLDPAILAAMAYGEYHPVAENATPEGKAKNRRIEIVLVPKE